MSGSNLYKSQKPEFIDAFAVDVVVIERKYMPLTTTERRHAAHRLKARGLSNTDIAELLRTTDRTVLRMLKSPPPPILDVEVRQPIPR